MLLRNIVSGKTRLVGGSGLSFDVGFDNEDSTSIFKISQLDFQNSEAVS
jgi:hypothetical protein